MCDKKQIELLRLEIQFLKGEISKLQEINLKLKQENNKYGKTKDR